MKKIFTLLFAAALTLSVSAQAFQGRAMQKTQPVARSAMEKVARTAGHAMNPSLFGAPTAKPAIRKAAQNFTPTFTQAQAWSFDSYYSDGTWDLDLYDASDNYVGTLGIVNTSTTSIVGTYDLADQDQYGYPGASIVVAAGDTVDATAGTFTISYVSTNASGVPTYHVAGDLTYNSTETLHFDHDFTVPYAIDYSSYLYYQYGYYDFDDCLIELDDAPFISKGDTIEVPIPNRVKMTYYSSDGDWYMYGTDSTKYTFILDVYGQQTGLTSGTYKLEDGDFYEDYCTLYDITTKAKVANLYDLQATFNVTTDTTYISAYYTLKDGHVYHVSAKSYDLSALDTITLTMQSSKLTDSIASYGIFMVAGGGYGPAGTDIYYAYAAFDADTICGTYTQDDQYTYYGYTYTYLVHIVGTDTTYIDFDDTFTYSANLNGTTYTATLEGLGEDAHYYIVNFTVTGVTALDEVAAEQKAVKVIEDGKMYIYKEDHKFNAQGQMIK